MKRFAATLFATCLVLGATSANAEVWELGADDSKIAFGSVKKDKAGEAHHFSSP